MQGAFVQLKLSCLCRECNNFYHDFGAYTTNDSLKQSFWKSYTFRMITIVVEMHLIFHVFVNLEIQIVFQISWQIGAGKYSHIRRR